MCSVNFPMNPEVYVKRHRKIILYNESKKIMMFYTALKLFTYLTKNWLLLQCKVYFLGGKRPYYKYTVSHLREIGVKTRVLSRRTEMLLQGVISSQLYRHQLFQFVNLENSIYLNAERAVRQFIAELFNRPFCLKYPIHVYLE